MSVHFADRRGSLVHSFRKRVNVEEELGVDVETRCGIGNFYPHWLQKFNTPKAFLINNAILGLLNGATYSYFVGCLSTLEKRYSYESKVSGIIMIGEEITPICFGFLIGYFGGKTHRPRFIAIALWIGFISCFVMALPYFLYGAIREVSKLDHYKNRTDFELCDSKEKEYFCDKHPTLAAVSFLFIGTCMKGFACNAYYTIGAPYLDDNVKKKNTAMYFATSMCIQLLGPIFGFLLSSLCLQFYEDPFYDPGYNNNDPRWIGAWWLGYVIIGILMLVFSFPMLLFPRRFPGIKIPITLSKEKTSNSSSGILKDLGDTIKRLVRNPLLMVNLLAGLFRSNGMLGYFILMPKYMETMFKQSASKANLIPGPVSIFGMVLGIMLGGILMKKFKPRPRVLTGGTIIVESSYLVGMLIALFISCPSAHTDSESLLTNSLTDLETECNRNCLCTTKSYTPICGIDDRKTYFSPCHAGCDSFNKTDDGNELFTNCHCLRNNAEGLRTGNAERGYCGFECQWLVLYVLVIFMGKLMSSIASAANCVVFLRCVDAEDKSAASGASAGLFSVLAYIPAPLIYGALSDSSCLVREHSCGKTGNCWIYDVDQLRYKLHGATALFLLLGSFFDVGVWYLSPRIKNLYGDEEPNDENNKNDGTAVIVDEGLSNGTPKNELELNGKEN